MLAGLLLVLCAGLLVPATALAQTTLVKNTGQTPDSASGAVGGTAGQDKFTQAQGFTTGSNSGGYLLDSIQVYISNFGLAYTPRVSIYSDSSGSPGSSLHVLTNPDSVTNNSLNTFTAPATPPTLAAGTTYFVVVEASEGLFGAGTTSAESEDTGGASGWTINNSRLTRPSDSGSWSTATQGGALRIAVNAPNTAPNTAPTASDGTVTTTEDTAYTFAASDFGFNDTDTGDTLASVKVTTLPAAGTGTLALSGTAVTLNQEVTKAQIDADNLTYTPPANANGTGYASFGFKVNDGTDESAAAYTMTINVTAVNNAATGFPTITGTATVNRTLTANRGTIADADGLPSTTFPTGYGFQWVRVDSGTETDIGGATSPTYRLEAADAGKTVKVRVSFTDAAGNAEARTSAAHPPSGGVQTVCETPALPGRTVIATTTVTVGSQTFNTSPPTTIYGFRNAAFGSLSGDSSFTLGSMSYTIEEMHVNDGGVSDGRFFFSVGREFGVSDERRLQVHVCDETFSLVQAGYLGDSYFFGDPDSGLDWSSETSRTVRVIVLPPETAPTVTASASGYYADSGLRTVLTGTQAGGTSIYTKVKFSEAVAHTESDGATARPEIFYKIGTGTAVQFDIVADSATLASGDCKRASATDSSEYHCLYTTTSSDAGAFTFEVGTNTQDTADNALASRYTHTTTLALVTDATLKPSPLAIAAESGARVEGEDLLFRVSLKAASHSLDSTPLCGGGICTRDGPGIPDAIQQLLLLNGARPNPGLVRQERIKLSVRVETSGSNPVQVHPEDTGERVIVISHQLPIQFLKVRTLSVADSNNSAIRVIVEELGGSTATRRARASVTVMDVSAWPAVQGTPVLSGAGDDGRWSEGETARVALTFSESVDVDTSEGTPSLGIELGGSATRSAEYERGSGTTTLSFAYTLVAGDGDHTSMAVTPDSLALKGGTIRSSETAFDALLGHAGAGAMGSNARSIGPQANFHNVPENHDGETPFTLTVAFGGAPDGLSPKRDAGSTFELEGGAITKSRQAPGQSSGTWELTVTPAGTGGVTVRVPAKTCTEAHAVCIDGRALSETAEVTIAGTQGSESETLPVVSIAAGETPVNEGTDLSFTLSRTGATDDALTVNVTVSESGDVLAGSPPTSATFAADAATATLSVATVDDETDEDTSTVTATLAAGSGYAVDADAGAAEGHVVSEDLAPITARFTQVVNEHGGSGTFLLRFAFSHEPAGYSYRTVRDHLFDVTGGAIERARRLVKDSNVGWELRVAPDGFGEVALSARATTDCAADYAACDAAGRRFDGELSTTIQGPPTLSVADATVEEAEGAALDFAVTLSRAVAETVTVDYATSNGSAAAGSDYTGTSGTLTFAANETAKTVSVPVLDDAHDEGSETVGFTLSNPSPARVKLADASAEGSIVNADRMPQAWIARFGRTVAEQAIEAVEGRFAAARSPGLSGSIAGMNLAELTGEADTEEAQEADAEDGVRALSDWLAGEEEREPETRTLTGHDLLTGSSFAMTKGSAEAGFASFWGRGAVTRFDGREGEMTLDGEVSSAMLGADFSRDALVAGLMVSHARGEGGYRSPAGGGEVESTLTALFPYGRIEASERLSLWGMAGYGEGVLTLSPDDAAALRPDLSFLMGAVGARGVLAGGDGGPVLALKSDAMAARTGTDAVTGSDGNLAAADADVSRLRLALEGSRPFPIGGTAVLTPSLEVGVRHDGGDAETGFGADIGAGLALSDAARGLTADIRARGLLTHEAGGFGARGLSGTLSFDPAPETERGLSLDLTQSVGGASRGGADALLGRTTLAGLGAEDDSGLDARRLDARIGYGYGVFEDRHTAIPELGLGLTNAGRELRFGWRLAERVSSGLAFEFGAEGTRREPAGGEAGAEHGLVLGFGWRLDGRSMASFELRLEGTLREAANDNTEAAAGLRIGASW